MIKINHSVMEDSSGAVKESRTEPHVIFRVNTEEFGVEAKKVLELVKYMPPLSITNNYYNAFGMTVFRGKMVPIVDLRMVFGLEQPAYNDHTVIIMVESMISDFGIIAEQVMDLSYFPVTSIKTVASYNLGEKTEYLKSVANIDGRLILLIDPEKMLELKQEQPGLETVVQYPAKLEMSSIAEGAPSIAGVEETIPEVNQMGDEKPAAYLVDQQELDDLLKELEPKPEEKWEPTPAINEAKKDLEGTGETVPDRSSDDSEAALMKAEQVTQSLAEENYHD
ncbi:MAG: hypothetical protein GXY86_05165 [Firmicutes bacterium]|nr:hypothetical protein [Bacillota bacterium]